MARMTRVAVATRTASDRGTTRARARCAPTSESETPRIAHARRATESTTPTAVPRTRFRRPEAGGSAVVAKCERNEVEELGEEGLHAGDVAAGAEGRVELAVQDAGPLKRATPAVEQRLDRNHIRVGRQAFDRDGLRRGWRPLAVREAEVGGEGLLEGEQTGRRAAGRGGSEEQRLDRDGVRAGIGGEALDRHDVHLRVRGERF